MAFGMSFGSLASARDRLRTSYDSNRHVVKRLTGTVESGVGAFGFAWLQMKYPNYEMVSGIDTALLGGIALNVLSYFDKGSGWGDHVSALGNGVLNVYLVKAGWNFAKSSGSSGTTTTTAGLLGSPVPAFHVPSQDLAAQW
jgi:hypothetical protein